MPRARRTIVVERDRHRLRALLAIRRNGSVKIEKVLVVELPEGLDDETPAAIGAWMAERLRGGGFGRAPATIAIAREHVVFKKMELPTVDPNELPEMTRLAFARELPFAAADAVIDYAATHSEGGSTHVIAVAAPRDIIERTREIARAAGLRVHRIALRGLGSAALLQSLGTRVTGRNLVIDVTGGNVEFCIVEDGVVLMSRAAMLDGDEPPMLAEQIITETRRTWMSSRIVEGESEVRHVVFLGDRAIADHALGPIGDMLHTEVIRLDRHPLVDSEAESMSRVWPLAGLLLERELRAETIDFNDPHKPIDRKAIGRKRMLMAAGVAVVVLFGGWTVRDKTLDGLESQVTTLRARDRKLTDEYARYFRDRVKLEHIEAWEEVGVAFLDHLRYHQAIVPAPPQVVLDGWSAALDFRGVEYDSKAEGRKWSSPHQTVFVIDGEAQDRAIADRVREALSRPDSYILASSGSDAKAGKRLAEGFTYRVTATADVPPLPGSDPDTESASSPQNKGESALPDPEVSP